ncbi:MAG: OB-fold nucleic acid binding domain-containing protein [Clostridia bacterium]
MIVGRPFEGEPRPLRNIENVEGDVIVRGEIILQEEKEIKSGKTLVQLDMTDYTGSITVKAFMEKDAFKAKSGELKKGKAILVKGHMEEDSFTHQRLLMADAMIGTKETVRKYRG